jgi:hypothetical protein
MKHQQRVYLTHPKMPAFVHGILNMPRLSPLGGGVIGLFLLTWVSLGSQVAQAWSYTGPVTGDPIAITTQQDSDELDLTAPAFTVSACVYQTRRNSGESSAILTKRGSENGWGLLLEGLSGNIGDTGIVKFRTLYTGKSPTVKSSVVASNQAISLNTWYHIAVAYQSGQAQIFINGIGDGYKALPAPMASEKVLRIGGDYDYLKGQDRYRWRGTLSNLQIDNTALSQAQIQTLSASCNKCQCPDPNNPFAACPSTCLITGGPTYTSGVIHIPQLSISGSNPPKTCDVYLLQQPSSFNFTLDLGRLTCNP